MESNETMLSRIREVAAVAFEPYLPMDVIVRTPSEVEERLRLGDSFVQEILDRGRILYDTAR